MMPTASPWVVNMTALSISAPSRKANPVLAGAHAVLAGVDPLAPRCARTGAPAACACRPGRGRACRRRSLLHADDRLERLRHEVEHLRAGLDDVPVAVDDGESALRHVCLLYVTILVMGGWYSGGWRLYTPAPPSVIPASSRHSREGGKPAAPDVAGWAAFLIRFFFRSLRVSAECFRILQIYIDKAVACFSVLHFKIRARRVCVRSRPQQRYVRKGEPGTRRGVSR